MIDLTDPEQPELSLPGATPPGQGRASRTPRGTQ
jgi:hypothetical protein